MASGVAEREARERRVVNGCDGEGLVVTGDFYRERRGGHDL